ncbi:hypothetical protein F5Y16DRAFT_268883 [Xylariaceae sp. FL0255]|nr:hypothetical protein F5Y16DRAFT_268883 [Xylariaceae sp. FL0255]
MKISADTMNETITILTRQCLQLFEILCTSVDISSETEYLIARNMGNSWRTFVFWCNHHRAPFSFSKERLPLDYTVQNTPEIRDNVIELLTELNESLKSFAKIQGGEPSLAAQLRKDGNSNYEKISGFQDKKFEEMVNTFSNKEVDESAEKDALERLVEKPRTDKFSNELTDEHPGGLVDGYPDEFTHEYPDEYLDELPDELLGAYPDEILGERPDEYFVEYPIEVPSEVPDKRTIELVRWVFEVARIVDCLTGLEIPPSNLSKQPLLGKEH